MEKHVDVVVIGAGSGGLGAALYTSKMGMKTLVLERHNLPGGAVTSFVRGRFEFEAALHEACEVGPKENRGSYGAYLDAMGVDIDWRQENNTFHMVVPSEGIDVNMPCGRQNFIDEMERQVPGCRESVTNFFEVAEKGIAGMHYMTDNAPANYFEGTPGATIQKLKHDAQMTKLKTTLATKYPDFLRMASLSINEGMDLLEIPKKAQNIMSSYWVYLGAPPKEMDFFTNAMMLCAYIDKGAAVPSMKSHEISLACDKAIRDHGGEIWYNTAAKELIVKDGKVVGVKTDKWDIYAKEVISNVNPHIVLGNMLDQKTLPENVLRYYNSKDLALNLYTAYIGLDISAKDLGVDTYSSLLGTTSDGDELYDRAHQLYSNGYTIVNCLNNIIPESSPEGTCTLFLTGMTYGDVWKDVKPEEYRRVKQKIAGQMIDQAEEAMGIDIRSHIEEIEIACAPTFVRYMGTPNGTPYGYQVRTNDGIPMRCMNEGEYHQIPGLHFCGATGILTDGFNCSCMSGAKSAQYAVEKINAESKRSVKSR